MKKFIAFSVIFASFAVTKTLAQISIAPTNIFIDNTTRFGTYNVINGSNQAQEVSINFFFGYSQSDENGDKFLVEEDSIAAESHSIADVIRAFPQNFTLAPGQRQVVRIRVSANNEIPDGTYWARIRTSSSPETPPVEIQNTEAVTASVDIKVDQVTGLFYKKGTVFTGIEINDISTQISDDGTQLFVLAEYLRTGNSPFLGSITVSLLNSQGNEVRSSRVSTSLYFDGIHKQAVDIEGLDTGNYTINITFESSRDDISDRDIVKMDPSSASATFSIR